MANIEGRDLLVLVQGRENEEGRSWNLRLVQWIVDGEPKSIKLEKRRYFRDDYGEQRTGKAEGFSLQDLELIRKNWEKIMNLMNNPPSVDQELPEEEKPIDTTSAPQAQAVNDAFPGTTETTPF